MQRCESKVGGACTVPATWNQAVHAGDRATGRVLYHSYWCDTHAEAVTERRRREWSPPPRMVRIAVEIS
jgi:hypothetical protein